LLRLAPHCSDDSPWELEVGSWELNYLIAPVAAPSAVPVFCTRSNVTAAS